MMKVLAARVVNGRVDVGDEIPNGTPVAVLAPDTEAAQLTVDEEAELTAALEEIHRGDYEDGFALLREIQAQHRQ